MMQNNIFQNVQQNNLHFLIYQYQKTIKYEIQI